jgi:delta 1-pyrroline-5-carboxylate dehydrogenase
VFIAEDGHYRRDNLVRERVISINTTAAGGNASLMTIG